MLHINEMDNDQRRHLINTQQVFEAFEHARDALRTRYSGSMRWVQRNGREYLLRKRGQIENSLGRRSPKTERIYRQFIDGRGQAEKDLESLDARLRKLAPRNVAMGLGRVPKLTARLLRRLRDTGLLGGHLHVVGTNALFGYEVRAGVFFEVELLATTDADLLMDARRSLRLVADDVRTEGVLGVLKRIDNSFAPQGAHAFRAVNRDGFYVDLIRPQTRRVLSPTERDRIGADENDLRGSPIQGLNWLVNAPKFSAVAIDEAGFPVRIDAIDPRAFALHKIWLSEQQDRDPLKKRRDRDQAAAVAILAHRYLGLSFNSGELSALPHDLRDQADRLLEAGAAAERGRNDEEPGWW